MDIYKQICAKLVEAWDNTAGGEYEDFGRAASYLVDWTRAELAKPEPEVPTDRELLAALKEAIIAFPPDHPAAQELTCVEYMTQLELRKARAILATCGSPAPQPVRVSERWPEFSDCDNAERVWCWNWRVGAWRLSQIDQGIHSHWLPAHALPMPSYD